jgi:hypothetical protein
MFETDLAADVWTSLEEKVFILRAIGEIGLEGRNTFLDALANTIEGEFIRRAISGGAD